MLKVIERLHLDEYRHETPAQHDLGLTLEQIR